MWISVAPEVLRKSGYREECDWWSVAVVAFELLFGKKPFRATSSREVMSKICHSEFSFPSSSMREISEECLDYISSSFEYDSTKRLGHKGVDEIKLHPFFAGIDWAQLEGKELHPPFTPNVFTWTLIVFYS
jgi:serine/threonine kinase 32